MKRQTEVRKGTYKGRPISAVFLLGTNVIRRFQYESEPGEWFFPLIENGANVEKEKFTFDINEQLTLF